MIPASCREGLNHVAVAHLNAASAAIRMSAFGANLKHGLIPVVTRALDVMS